MFGSHANHSTFAAAANKAAVSRGSSRVHSNSHPNAANGSLAASSVEDADATGAAQEPETTAETPFR